MKEKILPPDQIFWLEGIVVHFYHRVDSTMNVARALARTGWRGIVLAGEQSSGRGRYGRRWHSFLGGLYASWIFPVTESHYLMTVTTACLLNLMSAIGVEGCQVKWPNDIICKGKKIAGILIEQTGFCSIVGVGINVNNRVSNFLTGAVSVVEVTGKELPLVDVLREMVIVHRTLFGQTLDKKEGFLTWRGGLLKNE